MTEPSQYFKGRTVQEQMNEVISYVDVRAEEVAAAKADDVLEPAEQAKTDAIAAKEAAEDARDVTLAALPAIQQDIADLKAEDVSLDGRLDNVELRITTAEGNIVTIQGRVTAVETKNSQQDSAIAALQAADAQNVKINAINNYAVGLTGNQTKTGILTMKSPIVGTSQQLLDDSTGTDVIGQYKVIAKFPRNVTYGIRQHFLIGVVTRQRERPFDLLTLYINNSTALDLSFIVRANGENYTYILSQDTDYIYISIITRGNVGDGTQMVIFGATQSYSELPSIITSTEIYETVPGTEVKRLTP